MHLKNIVTSKMKPFVPLVDGFQPLANVTKNSISGVAEVLDHLWKNITCSKNCAERLYNASNIKGN